MCYEDVFLVFSIWTGECIGYDICLSLQITNVGCILCNVGELIRLPRCVRLGFFRECRDQGLMVCVQSKFAAFDEVSEMAYCAEGGE